MFGDLFAPSLNYPPISVHRFSEEALKAGVETHEVDGVSIIRNKIGMDIVLEGLKFYKARKEVNLAELIKYAKNCRVEKIMRPYLEAMSWT